MSRPRKGRRVCCLPEVTNFGPLDKEPQGETIYLSVEEYETIRLLDFEGLTQEQAATQMQVARTTVQRMYANARQKVAQMLFFGSSLQIKGGNYEFYSAEHSLQACRRCRRRGRYGRNRS